MEAYFAFTDECGVYQKNRSKKFLKSNPFYVRATVIISLEDYIKFQTEMDRLKEKFNIKPRVEIKWAHLGNAIKNNYKKTPHTLTKEQIKNYFINILSLIAEMESVKIYYTFTQNSKIGCVGEVALIKMHLQNALQKVQTSMAEKEGYAIVVADDLNDKTKSLKEAVYELTTNGDFVAYTNIKNGLYVDFSNQCQGLQLADICAGVFTSSLKYITSTEKEKQKYEIGYNMFSKYLYHNTRSAFLFPPLFEVYKYGIKEVPHDKGKEVALKISKFVADKLEEDFREMWRSEK